MGQKELDELLERQDGVVSRGQVLACHGTDNDIERRLRRREWARVHDGVYVTHTGPLSWRQRAWAATLVHHPAALAGASALRADGVKLDKESGPIEVAVQWPRRVNDPAGVITRQLKDLAGAARLHVGPPRLRIEHAALAVASRAAEADAAVAVLGQACQSRRTSADRLLEVAVAKRRLRQRKLILEVLGDVAAGTNSALERRYLVHVERPHALPVGRRQKRVVNGRVTAYRDVDYEDWKSVVELDGKLGHDGTEDRWDDLDRDVASAVAGDLTVRAGWRQVLDPCRLAAAVGAILAARGWPGEPVGCGRECLVGTSEVLRHRAPEDLSG